LVNSIHGKGEKNTEPKSLLNAHALMVGYAKTIQISPGGIKAAKLRETFVKIHSAIKILILFLYWDSPAKENHQSEKRHSALNISEASPFIFSFGFRLFFFENKVRSVPPRALVHVEAWPERVV